MQHLSTNTKHNTNKVIVLYNRKYFMHLLNRAVNSPQGYVMDAGGTVWHVKDLKDILNIKCSKLNG